MKRDLSKIRGGTKSRVKDVSRCGLFAMKYVEISIRSGHNGGTKSIPFRIAWVCSNVLTVNSLTYSVGLYSLIRQWNKLKNLQRSIKYFLGDKGKSTGVPAPASYLLFSLLNCKEKQFNSYFA
jgi:hypothetical protein